ncbi:hypothetical protein ACFQY0_01345 [Haloferula chungangensis]|uniref:Lipoprotein n=1 Tax=Haloferula chungangensis TaxID=1048331 RepID=A0ABW2L3R7_9BACT
MRSLLPILAIAVLFATGCDQREKSSDAKASPSDSHREAIAKFQDGQRRFKELIATVRDEKSFDAAKPGLEKVVSDWREVATVLGELEPPSEDLQVELRESIAEGHRATEPTGEDMLSLISIESRDAEVTKWLEEFVAAGGAAGAEMVRLYGPTDYAGPEAEAAQLDLSSATINGVTFDQALNNPTALIQQDKEAQQGGAGLPATRSESDSEGCDEPQPESEGRSR